MYECMDVIQVQDSVPIVGELIVNACGLKLDVYNGFEARLEINKYCY